MVCNQRQNLYKNRFIIRVYYEHDFLLNVYTSFCFQTTWMLKYNFIFFHRPPAESFELNIPDQSRRRRGCERSKRITEYKKKKNETKYSKRSGDLTDGKALTTVNSNDNDIFGPTGPLSTLMACAYTYIPYI